MGAVSNRYARAFADVVFERKLDPGQTLSDLKSVLDLVNTNLELKRVWENPSIPVEQKRKLLDAVLERMPVSKPVRNFLAILIDHHRIDQLPEIANVFETELNERLGFTEADISSARELSETEKRALEHQIANLTGKRVRATYTTSPGLLGGAVVRVGSTIYDGSVRGQLRRMKEQLSS